MELHTLFYQLSILAAVFMLRQAKAQDYFASEIIAKYGLNSKMNATQLENIIEGVARTVVNGGSKNSKSVMNTGVNNSSMTVLSDSGCVVTDYACLTSKCLSAKDIFMFHMIPEDATVNISELTRISPAVLYQLQNEACYNKAKVNPHGKKSRPSSAEVWGYGILCVTIINICAALGVIFYPVMHTKVYKKVLMCMVGLAVGTLSGSGIFVLIPETFQLVSGESLVGDKYIWRALVIVGGIYLFFTTERLLNYAIKKYTEKKSKSPTVGVNGRENTAFDEDVRDVKSTAEITLNNTVEGGAFTKETDGPALSMTPDAPIKPIAMKWAPISSIKSVAWMIVFGDALHNFVDGLSIGSAFSENILSGVSISLAVFCEELPHELGDFAILLNSGMSIRQALLMNVLSAMTCYIGLVIGILVGSLEEGSLWIFAVAGGMFLYISLADMLPEMNEQAREEEEKTGSMLPSYLLQNVGMLSGWLIIFLLALYAGNINFT